MSNILYQTGVTQDNTPLFGGLWKMKTEMGFPLEMSWMECKERKICPDWAELLADAGSVPTPAWEFDLACEEIKQFIPDLFDEIYNKFVVWFNLYHRNGEDFSETCRVLLNQKRKSAASLDRCWLANSGR